MREMVQVSIGDTMKIAVDKDSGEMTVIVPIPRGGMLWVPLSVKEIEQLGGIIEKATRRDFAGLIGAAEIEEKKP